ncbi:MAG: YheC/YheD family protein [Bacillota bacterium]|nr:YheC/YheD family protein [Bacillota bacterium]
MFYRILSSKETKGRIYLPAKCLKRVDISKSEELSISAGRKTLKAQVEENLNGNDQEVVVSSDVMEGLLLTEGIEYQIILGRKGIRIGPVLGLLMFRRKKALTPARLRKLMSYTNIYPEIRGLLIAFSSEGIDFKNKCVEGYCYNPGCRRAGEAWKAGVFPLPDSIFQRTSLPDKIRIKLKEETGNRMFNSNYFDKWEFWQLITSYKPYCQNIPYTRLYSSIEDVDYIIDHYGAAYLKPINGTLSRGLYKVTLHDGIYGFQGKQGREVTSILSKEEAEDFIKEAAGSHKYIVQQAINPLKVKGRHMDFRVIMQKDHTMNWSCTGIIALIGARGDICTNWGSTSTFDDILYKAFDFSQKEIYKKKREVIAACKCVCEILDQTGENYGDLGFDVMIDEDQRVWVFEANKRHYHTVPLWVNDVQTFYSIKSNTVKYAAALAGYQVYR